ncbi:SGNH/GDSL hydrolase family protein [Lentzea guizhouensis]|nr:SGNH/GDSL hydrolase family protein [Lentzea guizhouensis]
MFGLRHLRAVTMTAATLGGLSGALVGLLNEQGRRARVAIGVLEHLWPAPDGVYRDDGGEPVRFAVLGDSMAVGVGVTGPSQMPGVLLAQALAEEAVRPVRLTTYAISGSTTRDLVPQVDRAVADEPQVALVIIGANDVTTRMPVRESAALLGEQVRRLREIGCGVVVGTCPDLGIVRPIPQPLRAVGRRYGLRLAAAQTAEVRRAAGPRCRSRTCWRRSSWPGTSTCSAPTGSTQRCGLRSGGRRAARAVVPGGGSVAGWAAPAPLRSAALAVGPSRWPAWLQRRHV